MNVDVVNNIAAFEMVQQYYNVEDIPIETVFLFPIELKAAISRLTVDFGTHQIETQLEPRKKAEAKYSDAVASGKTAAIGKIT